MTWFDALVLIVIGLSTLFAVIRGFAKELATILTIVLAVLVSAYGLNLIGTSGSLVMVLLIGLALFVGAFAIFAFVFGWVAERIHVATGGQADNILGGIFGFLRGLALVGLLYLAYSYYAAEDRQPAAVREALVFPVVKATAVFFDDIAPEWTRIDFLQPAAEDEIMGDEDKDRDDEDAETAALTFQGSSNAFNAPMSAARYSAGEREGLSEVIAVHATGDSDDDPSTQERSAARPE